MNPSQRAILCRLRLVLGTLTLLSSLAANAAGEEINRTWRDATGKFEVEAKLVESDEKQVKLLKADGLIVSVPIAALSKEDQEFVAQHKKEHAANPFAGGVPAKKTEPKIGLTSQPEKLSTGTSAETTFLSRQYEAKELPATGDPIFLDSNEPVPPLEPDADKHFPKLKNFVQPLFKIDAYAKASAPICLDPKEGTFAVSVHRAKNASLPETFGRIYLYHPEQKKPQAVLEIDQTLLIYAHHIPSGRTLAVIGFDGTYQGGGDLVLLEGLAQGKPTAIGRWHLPDWNKPGFSSKIEYARLLDASRALVRVRDIIYVWDLEKQTLLHRVDRVQGGAKVECSPHGKYLAIPTSGRCRLVDLTRGELLGSFKLPTLLTPEAKFSPDGTKLALAVGNQIFVWDLTTGERKHEITITDPCGDFIGWLNDRQILTQLGGVIDLELELSLWKYQLAAIRGIVPVRNGIVLADTIHGSFVCCLSIPHSSVLNNSSRLQIDDAKKFILRPGSRVAIETKVIEAVNEEEMKSGLQKAVERAGWVVDPTSTFKVSAVIGRGQEQTFFFRTLGEGYFQPGEKVSIRPYTATITIRDESRLLWQRSSTNMVPSFLFLKAGQSLQQGVKEYEKADPEYFVRLMIPPKIMAPEFAKSIGTSYINDGEWMDQ